MGVEMNNMDMHDLEDILYETSKFNHEDFKTFEEALLDMYGGINTGNMKKVIDFMQNDLGLKSDAELTHLDDSRKKKIVEFVSRLN
jgi:hypothetical protein